jgi:transposase
MDKINTIGLDLAKSVFQVHCLGENGEVVLRRQLRRAEVLKFFSKLPPCLIGMEACASSHYWAREIAALGHRVRLIAPTRVKAYVKWGKKNDATDAAAIAEAVTRPSMQFVPIKTVEQQAVLMLHRARKLLVEQRTRLRNAIRAHMAEMGIIAAQGEAGFTTILTSVDDEDGLLPPMARQALAALAGQWRTAGEQIAALDRQIVEWHKSNDDSRRVASIPQIGAITASTLVATIGDATRFDSGRQFAAWLGLVPRQNSSGGKDRLGGITKTGDRYVRQLLVIAATGMLRRIRKDETLSPWFAQLLKRKPPKQAAVALANKLARIAWAILAKGGLYKSPAIEVA